MGEFFGWSRGRSRARLEGGGIAVNEMLIESYEPAAIGASPQSPVDDYERVRDALAYVAAQRRRQPSLDEIAAHVGLPEAQFHALFRRYAGLTPKAFLQAVTLDHAKRLLDDQAS